MNFWLDAEWNDFRGDLISMALVDEDGREWYGVLECLDPTPWDADNVMPVLNQAAVSIMVMRDSLYKFLRNYDDVHVIADWPEDIQHFCALLIAGPGDRIETPPLTFEIWNWEKRTKPTMSHNSLSDALALRDSYPVYGWIEYVDDTEPVPQKTKEFFDAFKFVGPLSKYKLGDIKGE